MAGRGVLASGRHPRLRLTIPAETSAHAEPPLTEHDARLADNSIQIEIPITDRQRLRHVAELLRDLAGDLEAASRKPLPPVDHPDFHRQRRLVLWDIALRTDSIRRRLREHVWAKIRSDTMAASS